MEVTPVVPTGRQIIQSYGQGGFKITDQRYAGAVLVSAEQTLHWPIDSFDALTVDSVAPILEAAEVEILLIGTGPKHKMLPPPIRAAFSERGVVAETMVTAAACRTYNVLMAEERRVAAALIPIE
ncbi:MAG: Mth938-like domain-containing protein [Pseudomonadota bacterium]